MSVAESTEPISEETADPGPVKGTSLWSDAWKRLKKNKIAITCMGLIILITVSGFSAPLIAEHVTHFSRSEAHTRLSHMPPGVMDVSKDYPSFDGNKASFALLDLNGDGVITCERPDGDMDVAPTCPELQVAHKVASLHFDHFFNAYDKVTGPGPVTGSYQPDGYVTWNEFPKTDAELKRKQLKGMGLTGLDAFKHLDIDGDHVIASWEITERSRLLRYPAATRKVLLRDFDSNADLKLSPEEWPGAPALHVFWLGTDRLGRDILTRVLYGARISMLIAFLTTFVAFFIGVTYGSISGYFGGRVDYIMMRIVDVMYGLPYFFILIILLVVWGKSVEKLFIALGLFYWLNLARVVRGQVISLKTREFVEAARAIGVSNFGIIFKHLLPNTVGPVVVYATLLVPGVILSEAFLSFLGLGVQPPEPSWGNMITDGAKLFQDFPWTLIWPGLMLTVTLFALNFVGDGVRDAIDPKTQKE